MKVACASKKSMQIVMTRTPSIDEHSFFDDLASKAADLSQDSAAMFCVSVTWKGEGIELDDILDPLAKYGALEVHDWTIVNGENKVLAEFDGEDARSRAILASPYYVNNVYGTKYCCEVRAWICTSATCIEALNERA